MKMNTFFKILRHYIITIDIYVLNYVQIVMVKLLLNI